MYDLRTHLRTSRENLPTAIYKFVENTPGMNTAYQLAQGNILGQLAAAEDQLFRGNPSKARYHYRFMLELMEKYTGAPINPPDGTERWFAWEIAEKKRLGDPRNQCQGTEHCNCTKHKWVMEAFSRRQGKICRRCRHRRVNYRAKPEKYSELTPALTQTAAPGTTGDGPRNADEIARSAPARTPNLRG